MKSLPFTGKVAWITGASTGIGAALAITLGNMGALLIISARNKENLEQVKASCANPNLVNILVADMATTDILPDIAEKA